ncbi:hypothetical protein V3C99_018297 [Haemonchus contortus]|uniref:Uncharacterized protein n=1 Tax=Haemonchus contortus TaxID=6289 RepID=A0A7I4Z3K0_HAECO
MESRLEDATDGEDERREIIREASGDCATSCIGTSSETDTGASSRYIEFPCKQTNKQTDRQTERFIYSKDICK